MRDLVLLDRLQQGLRWGGGVGAVAAVGKVAGAAATTSEQEYWFTAGDHALVDLVWERTQRGWRWSHVRNWGKEVASQGTKDYRVGRGILVISHGEKLKRGGNVFKWPKWHTVKIFEWKVILSSDKWSVFFLFFGRDAKSCDHNGQFDMGARWTCLLQPPPGIFFRSIFGRKSFLPVLPVMPGKNPNRLRIFQPKLKWVRPKWLNEPICPQIFP